MELEFKRPRRGARQTMAGGSNGVGQFSAQTNMTDGCYDRDFFDYIEMFYNPKRNHGFNNKLSPVNYEKQYFERLASV